MCCKCVKTKTINWYKSKLDARIFILNSLLDFEKACFDWNKAERASPLRAMKQTQL